MTVFSNIIPRKRVLDAGQSFSSSHVCNDRLLTEKFYRVKCRLFQQNLTFDHLYLLKTKSRKIIPNVAR